jgi:hypothetical protein
VLPISDASKRRAKRRAPAWRLSPSFTIARFRSQTNSDHPVILAGRERLYEDLRLAGVPEGEQKTN